MTLKNLVLAYGKQKVNTLTKYPSILTLHQMGEKGRLQPALTTDLAGEQLFATEKIDGTNVRILCLGPEFLVGSREFILHHSDDLYYDNAQGIVDGVLGLGLPIPRDASILTVVYGELFGGRISANSKQYGTDGIGFRVFDVAVFPDLSILEKPVEEISRWREQETPSGMVYGQYFLPIDALHAYAPSFDLVPSVPFDLGDCSHQAILDKLREYLPQTQVALSPSALKKPEGVVLRNRERTKIVKLRYEDYERSLR